MIKRSTANELPVNYEAECSVVGSVIVRPDCLDAVLATCQPSDFTDDGLRKFFESLIALHEAGRPANDSRVVIDHLRKSGVYDAVGGAVGVAKVFQSVPHAAHAVHYAKIVANCSARRKQLRLAEELLSRAYDPAYEAAENQAWVEAQIGAIGSHHVGGARSVGEIATESVEAIAADLATERKPGVMTGLYCVDNDLGPLQCGELIILAARPSIGKTALGLQVAEHVATKGKKALVVSLEMRDRELVDRMLANHSGVNGRRMRARSLSDQDVSQLRGAAGAIGDLPLFVWAPPVATISQIRGVAKLEAARQKLAFIAVDYLGLIKPADRFRPRHEQVAESTASLKALAKELDVPILCLCQLNREAESQVPSLSMLRDSGAVEQDADVVMFLHKESRKDPTAELIIAKSRNGETSTQTLQWDGAKTKFWCDQEPKPNRVFNDFNNS